MWLFQTPSLAPFSCLVCLQPGSVTCVPKASPTPSPLPSATADAPGALCPAGSYCAPGTTFVSVLHALAHLLFSSSLTSHDQRHVAPCTAASVRLLLLHMQTYLCPAGNYCPAGSTAPLLCPPGNFCPEGVSMPVRCRPGFFCPVGAATPVQCPAGTFSSAVQAFCTPCPAGCVAP